MRLNDSQFNGIVRIGQALYKETYTLNEKIKSQIRAPLEQFHQVSTNVENIPDLQLCTSQ